MLQCLAQSGRLLIALLDYDVGFYKVASCDRYCSPLEMIDPLTIAGCMFVKPRNRNQLWDQQTVLY